MRNAASAEEYYLPAPVNFQGRRTNAFFCVQKPLYHTREVRDYFGSQNEIQQVFHEPDSTIT
jgi:hypothetical protein